MNKNFLNILFVLLIIFNIALTAFAENIIKFNNNEYKLTYSKKNQNGGFFNEYTKDGQTAQNWNELIVVHYFPNAKAPLTEANKIAGFITAVYAKQSKRAPVEIAYNEKQNAAIVDYAMPVKDKVSGNLKYIEFTVFKFQKSSKGNGVTALQYSKKFFSKNLKDEKLFQEALIEVRKNAINAMTEAKIPQIVEKEIL